MRFQRYSFLSFIILAMARLPMPLFSERYAVRQLNALMKAVLEIQLLELHYLGEGAHAVYAVVFGEGGCSAGSGEAH